MRRISFLIVASVLAGCAPTQVGVFYDATTRLVDETIVPSYAGEFSAFTGPANSKFLGVPISRIKVVGYANALAEIDPSVTIPGPPHAADGIIARAIAENEK